VLAEFPVSVIGLEKIYFQHSSYLVIMEKKRMYMSVM